MYTVKKIKQCYFSTYHDRIMMGTLSSFSMNILFGVTKVLLGVYYQSFWLLITGSYYVILSLVRGYVLRESKKMKQRQCSQRKLLIYRVCGWFILFLGINYFGVCVLMYVLQKETVYPSSILYGVVAVAFYKIIFACVGLLVVRKYDDLLLSIVKIANFLDACVSIVAIQCALLVDQKSVYALVSSTALGIAVSLFFMCVGIFMVRRKIAIS